METVTTWTHARQDAGPTEASTTSEVSRTLHVAVIYRLSEAGRKASLLAGGDGRAVQELTLQVPVQRLHLVTVDVDGIARLKLQPQYQQEGDHRVVRIDSPPTYDAPPDLETLCADAARNHQLERVYHAERREAVATPLEA